MAEDIGVIVKRTQETLGAIVKKPPLTEKLLGKPPFRFLHDVICAVIKTTGFMDGLYSPEELDAANIKDRDGKIRFLQKAIDCVQWALGQGLLVKPSKVVAGQEPEMTNRFLQALAQATTADNLTESVQNVLENRKPNFATSNGNADSNKENQQETNSNDPEASVRKSKKSSSSKDDKKDKEKKRDRSRSKDPSGASTSKDHTFQNGDVPKESKASSSKSKTTTSSKTKGDTKDKADEASSKHRSSHHAGAEKAESSKENREEKKKHGSSSKSSSKTRDKSKDSSKERKHGEKSSKKDKSEKKKVQEPEPAINPIESDQTNNLPDAVASSIENNIEPNDLLKPTTELSPQPSLSESPRNQLDSTSSVRQAHSAQPPSAARPGTAIRRGAASARPGTASGQRPTTARPAPPRVRKTLEQSSEDTLSREGSAASGTNISALISEQPVDDTNEADQFIVQENTDEADTLVADEGFGSDNAVGVDAETLEQEEHGGLVRKILETKKDLESGIDETAGGSVEEKRPGVTVFDEKDRERVAKDASKLQNAIQQLTRTSHPLGKLMDYLQEDVDSMLKELEQWRSEYQKNNNLLRQQQGSATEGLEPLKLRLEQLEQQITEQHEKLGPVKNSLLETQQKIKQLTSKK